MGISVFYSDFEDIDYFEKLNEKNENYIKILIRSYNYGGFFKTKFFKTYVTFYLDEKGLEIFTKLLKEKAPNAEIRK